MAEVTLYAKDAYVDSANPTTNFGATDYLIVNDTCRAFVGFDLSSIPAGSVILSAVLKTQPFYAGIAKVNYQRCTATWDEGTLTWNNAPAVVDDKDVLEHLSYGAQYDFIEHEVTTQVQNALAGGEISWRIAVAMTGEYLPDSWWTSKDYTADGCSQLVVTYAPAGTAIGWIDVPVTLDARIRGSETYENPPAPDSLGLTVYNSPTTLPLYNSSSIGRDMDRLYTLFNLTTANLVALGMPSGATITLLKFRIFCRQAWGGNMAAAYLMYAASEALGTTINGYPFYGGPADDWNFPGCTSLGNKSLDFNDTGWKAYTIPARNTTGLTPIGLKTGAGVTDPSQAIFSGAANADGNAPVVRVYYQYNLSIKLLSEVLSVSGIVSFRFARTILDALTVAGTLLKRTVKNIADALIAGDSISRQITRPVSDTIIAGDPPIVRSVIKLLAETVLIVEAVKKSFARWYADALTATDTLTKQIGSTFKDLLKATATVSRQIARTVADTLSPLDKFIRGRIFGEVITATDSFYKRLNRVFYDTGRVGEGITRAIARVLADSASITEWFTKSRGQYRIFADSFVLSDFMAKLIHRTVGEGIRGIERWYLRLNGKSTAQWSRTPKDLNPDWRKQNKDL